jgi:hypothetical protein
MENKPGPTYTVKKVIVFPVPSPDVTNQTHPARELLNYSQPGRVCLVTFRLEMGKTITFFYSVESQSPNLNKGMDIKKEEPCQSPFFLLEFGPRVQLHLSVHSCRLGYS